MSQNIEIYDNVISELKVRLLKKAERQSQRITVVLTTTTDVTFNRTGSVGVANNICLVFSILFGQSCEQYMCRICYIRVEELNVQGFSIGPNRMYSSKNIGYSKIFQTQRAISPFVDGAIKQENLYRQW